MPSNSIPWGVVYLIVMLLLFSWCGRERKSIDGTPSYVVRAASGVYIAIGTIGYLYYRYSDSYWKGFYDAHWTVDEIGLGATYFLMSAGSVLLGSVLYKLLPQRSVRYIQYGDRARNRSWSAGRRWRGFRAVFVVLSVIPLIINIVAVGPTTLLFETSYPFSYEYPTLLRVGALLSYPVFLGLGMRSSGENRRGWRMTYRVVAMAYLLFFLSCGSRASSMVILLYGIGSIFGTLQKRQKAHLMARATLMVVGVVSTLYFSLIARTGAIGVYSLSENVVRSVTSLSDTTADFIIGSLIANTTYGVPLTGYVASFGHISFSDFLISIDPLPSFLMDAIGATRGWYDISLNLRLAEHIPYSALGELASQGIGWLVLATTFLGVLIEYTERCVRRSTTVIQEWSYLAVLGMLLFSVFLSTQYNLRSFARFIYYGFIILCLLRLVFRHKLGARNQGHNFLSGRPFSD